MDLFSVFLMGAQMDDPPLAALIQQANEGSEEAAQCLYERYAAHVLRAVRRSLAKELRGKFDSIDFTQAVWASFFRNPLKFKHPESPEAFVGYLAQIARNKVLDEFRRRLQTQKYNIHHEQTMDRSSVACHLYDNAPTPSEVVMANDRWHDLLESVPDRQRPILEMRREGLTNEEIAAALGINEKTVRRVMKRLESQADGRFGPHDDRTR